MCISMVQSDESLEETIVVVTNKHEIRVFGLRRSGNHAVISWILQNFPAPAVHLNDLRDRSLDPYQAFSQVSVKGLNFWSCKPKLTSFLKYQWQRPPLVEFTVVDPKLNVEYIRNFRPKECLIVSYEDYELTAANLQRYDADRDRYVGSSDRIVNVAILRDAYNLFASLLKVGFLRRDNRDALIALFKQYARVHLGEVPDTPFPLVCINYNRWCEEADYRIAIAKQIGFETSGEPFLKVSHKGGGSSFDRLAAQDNPGKLKQTRERWRRVADRPDYRAIFQDEELRSLSDRVFGPIADLSEIEASSQ